MTDVATFWLVVFLPNLEANEGGSVSVSHPEDHSRRHSVDSPPPHHTPPHALTTDGPAGFETAHVASLVPPNKNKA